MEKAFRENHVISEMCGWIHCSDHVIKVAEQSFSYSLLIKNGNDYDAETCL